LSGPAAGAALVYGRAMSDKQKPLTYEGRVYVRPVGRGIVLSDEPGEPQIEDWIGRWIAQHTPVSEAGGAERRLRLVVERVDGDAGD
jgi:hypothetical protein